MSIWISRRNTNSDCNWSAGKPKFWFYISWRCMYSLVPGPKLCLSESSYSVLIIQPELYTSKITFSGVFVMLKCHGTRNSYWVIGQEINSKQTHKIFFFPWEMGHAQTVTQVLVSKEHSDILFTAYVMSESSHTEMILLKHYGSYAS